MTIEFRFSIGDKVMIREIQSSGHISGLSFNGSNREARVEYWREAKRKIEWLPEDDLDLLLEEPK